MRLIGAWQRSGGSGIQARIAAEKKAVVKLAATPTAKNLIRVFFLQERLKAVGGKDSGISKVHVVGAGVMGGDIAAWAAYKGFEVTLQDREQRFIDAAQDARAGAVREEGEGRSEASGRRRTPEERPGRRQASRMPTW